MKKITLLAAIAAATMSVQAQYTAEVPYLQPISENAANEYFDYIQLQEGCVNKLTAAGKKVQAIGPDGDTRNLWVWDGTFNAGDGSYPGVGWNADEMNFDGYISFDVGTAGWSGAGFADAAPGVDLSHMNESTRFHAAYRTAGTAPASVAFILLDIDGVNKPAKVAVGDNFNDNGAIYPAIGPKAAEDWNAVDISFADLKRLFPDFDYTLNAKQGATGNVLSILGGGVTGTNISLDAIYYYTPKTTGIGGIAADDAAILYTGRTINAAGAQEIALYDMAGNNVRTVKGSVMGTDGLAKGMYVAKAGRSVAKIVVR